MGSIELKEEMLDKSNKRLIENFRRFKGYNTIRRNLRQAHDLITSIIELESNLTNEDIILEYEEEIYSSTISFHYLIVLYARWFHSTKGKPTLEKDKFFKGDTEYLLETHDYIIQLRNQYIAHNEKDLLGGDNVYLHLDSMANIKISSDWSEQVIANKQTLEKVKKCIEAVHNIIDAEEIPKYEAYLEKEFKENPSILRSLINQGNK